MKSIPLVMGLKGACGVRAGDQGTALPCPCGEHGAGLPHSHYLCPGASSATARDLTRFLGGPAGMGLGEGEGGTGASQRQGKGQGQSQSQHWGHRGVSQHCPTLHPLWPSHRPLISVPSPWNSHHPLPPTALGTVPSDSTQQGTVQPVQPSPGPRVPRAGDSGTHLPGGRSGRQVRAQRP